MTKIDPGSSEIAYNYWQIHQDPISTKIISGGYLQHLWPIKIYLFHIGRLQLGHIKMDVKSIKKAHWLQNPHQTAGSYNQQFPSLPITKAHVEYLTKSTWLQSHIMKKDYFDNLTIHSTRSLHCKQTFGGILLRRTRMVCKITLEKRGPISTNSSNLQYLTTYIAPNISDHMPIHISYKAQKTYIYLESPEEECEFVGCAWPTQIAPYVQS